MADDLTDLDKNELEARLRALSTTLYRETRHGRRLGPTAERLRDEHAAVRAEYCRRYGDALAVIRSTNDTQAATPHTP